MKVVILARTVREAKQYARDAKLAPRDTITVGSCRALEGLRLSDEDLIVQFPTFAFRRDADDITDVLLRSITFGKTAPRWERIGKK